MRGISLLFITSVVFLSMFSFAVADSYEDSKSNNDSINIDVNDSAKTSNKIDNEKSESDDESKNDSKKEEKLMEKNEKAEKLKREAEEIIANVEAKIAKLKESEEKSNKTEKAIEQATNLLEQAKKHLEKGNYFASIAQAKAAISRLGFSQDKVLSEIEERLKEKEQSLKEREHRLKEREEKLIKWEERLSQRIDKIEERIKRFEHFAEIVERYEGRLKVFIEEGKNSSVEIRKERKEIIAGKINAKLELNLTGEDIGDNLTTIAAVLSNGKLAQVKVMPDRASLIALKRLKAKCGEEECQIELKEASKGKEKRPVYSVKTEKESRIFFIFPKKMIVKAEVDAESGEIIEVVKPWWSFVAKEKHASEEEIEADVGELE